MSELTAQDYAAHLLKRINSEILDVAGVMRVTKSEAALLGIRLDCDGGVDYQYFHPPLNGNQTTRPVYHRVRQDKPPVDASGKVERKYLVPPGKCYPYIPRGIPREWFSQRTDSLIVEGPKQALAVLRWALDYNRPIIPIGINGAWGWSGTVGKAPGENGERQDVHDILDLIESVCFGRRVYLLFDADENTNVHVRAGRDRLAQCLLDKSISSDVRLLHLPPSILEPHAGADDFLGKCDDKAFADLFEESERVQRGVIETVLTDDSSSALAVEDMPANCLSGRLGEIGETYLRKFPRAYAYSALLANASALIQRRVGAPRTNIFVVTVGESRSGKTEADLWARSILGVSPLSLITGFIGSGEQFVVKYGEADRAPRLFDPDEAAHFLAKAMLDNASFPTLFTRAWGQDCFPMTVGKQKKNEDHLFNMHLSFYGGLVAQKFEDAFGSASTAGFYQRCFFAHGPTGFAYHYRPVPPELHSCERREPAPCEIDESVWEQLDDWRKEDPAISGILECCLRATTISASFDGCRKLTAKDLGPMRHLIDYQKSIRAILRPNEGLTVEGKITDRLRRYLESVPPGHGVSKRKLYTATNIHRFSTTTADRVVRSLVAQGIFQETRGKRADTTILSIPPRKDFRP